MPSLLVTVLLASSGLLKPVLKSRSYWISSLPPSTSAKVSPQTGIRIGSSLTYRPKNTGHISRIKAAEFNRVPPGAKGDYFQCTMRKRPQQPFIVRADSKGEVWSGLSGIGVSLDNDTRLALMRINQWGKRTAEMFEITGEGPS